MNNEKTKPNMFTLRLDDDDVAMIEALRKAAQEVSGFKVNKTDIARKAIAIGLSQLEHQYLNNSTKNKGEMTCQ
jgi:hypothetical protein